MPSEVQCWSCMGTYIPQPEAICAHHPPSYLCPYCYACACMAPPDVREHMLAKLEQAGFHPPLPKQPVQNPLGETLIARGLLNPNHLEQALRLQQEQGGRLGDLLVNLGYITPEELAIALVSQQWIDTVDLQAHPPDTTLIEHLGPALCRELELLPLEHLTLGESAFLRIAIADRQGFRSICCDPRLSAFRLIPYLAEPELFSMLMDAVCPPVPPSPATDDPIPEQSLFSLLLRQKGHRLVLASRENRFVLSLHSGTQQRTIQNAHEGAHRLRERWLTRLHPPERDSPAGGCLLPPSETGLPQSLLLRRRPHLVQDDLLLLTWSPESNPLVSWSGPGDRIRRECVREATRERSGLFLVLSGPEEEPDELLFTLLTLLGGRHLLLGPELIDVPAPGPWLNSTPPSQELSRRVLALAPDNLTLSALNHQIYPPDLMDFSRKRRLIVSLRAETPLQALQILSAGHGIPLERLSQTLVLVLHQRRLALLCPHCRRESLASGAWERGKGCPKCQGSGLLENRRLIDVIPGHGNPGLRPLPPCMAQTARSHLQSGLCSPTDAHPLIGAQALTG